MTSTLTPEEIEIVFFDQYTPQPGDIVVEVGAAEGTETELISGMVGPTGRVIAVEPYPPSYAKLARACRTRGNVRTVQRAIGPVDGIAYLLDQGIPWRAWYDSGIDATETVEACTLDTLTEDLVEISLLKMNIEGGEIGALDGGEVTLAKTRHVVVSCHDFIGVPTRDTVARMLIDAGFDVRRHSNPGVLGSSAEACLSDYLYGARV